MRVFRCCAIALQLLLLSLPCAARDLLVSSRFSDNVLRYDGASGAFVGVFASGDGLDNPNGIAYGPDGHLYVGLGDVGRVMVFDGQRGTFLRDFVVPSASGGLGGCRDIAFLPDGDLLVDNGPGNNVLRYEAGTGRFKGVFASGNGLSGPVGLSVAANGDVYVGAALVNAVYVYGPGGEPRATLRPPAGESQVTGVEPRANGQFLVAMSVSNNVLRLDPAAGTYAPFATGTRPSVPIGILELPDGDVLVGSFVDDKVLRYDGATGAYERDFVAAGAGGLDGTHNLALMPTTLELDDRFDGAYEIAGAERQGVLVDVSKEASVFFAAMFTYEPVAGGDGRAAWYVFQGALAPRALTVPAYRVPSGRFLSSPAAQLEQVGAGDVELVDCANLRMRVRIEGTEARDVVLRRLVPNASCTP